MLPCIVGISGLIVGIAGALSMGIGALISVRFQKQINESIKERLEILFSVSPERARKEFIERLTESGLLADIADQISKELKEDAIVDFLIEEVSENEVRAAFYTGVAYLIGVAFPVLPYFIAKSSILALPFSVLLVATALGVVGLYNITNFRNISKKKGYRDGYYRNWSSIFELFLRKANGSNIPHLCVITRGSKENYSFSVVFPYFPNYIPRD